MDKYKTIAISLTLASMLCGPFAYAGNSFSGCAAKRHNIERQIEYAKAHGNQHRVNGLQTALSHTERNCSDTSLQRDRLEKIREKEHKVSERTAELIRAQETGSQDKITHKMKKLDEAKAELSEARSAAAG